MKNALQHLFRAFWALKGRIKGRNGRKMKKKSKKKKENGREMRPWMWTGWCRAHFMEPLGSLLMTERAYPFPCPPFCCLENKRDR